MIGETIAFVGALTILVSAVGVLRFKDTLSRLHALTKASTLGILLLFGGAAIVMPMANDWTSLTLAMAFQCVTSPISAILISRSVYAELVARPSAGERGGRQSAGERRGRQRAGEQMDPDRGRPADA